MNLVHVAQASSIEVWVLNCDDVKFLQNALRNVRRPSVMSTTFSLAKTSPGHDL